MPGQSPCRGAAFGAGCRARQEGMLLLRRGRPPQWEMGYACEETTDSSASAL